MNLIELRNKVLSETVEKETAHLRKELPGLLEGAVHAYPAFDNLYIHKNVDGTCSVFSIDEANDLVVYLPATTYGNLRLEDIKAVCEELDICKGCDIGTVNGRMSYVRISYEDK